MVGTDGKGTQRLGLVLLISILQWLFVNTLLDFCLNPQTITKLKHSLIN